MLHRELIKLTLNVTTAIEWMLDKGYLKNSIPCTKCIDKQMKVRFKKGQHIFKCTKCNTTKSILYKTIFYNCKKDILELLDLIYFWSLDLNQKRFPIKQILKAMKQ
ncbi:hypothetical protein H311_00191 [Anncaliia algerae PRA109]|nr:hypothetical protein H311_00191 [Anncaliia algerae PRA109]